MESGERYCLLVEKETGLPLYYPNLFVTTQARNSSQSVSSMEAILAGLNVLLSFCDDQKIDLSSRILKCEFFQSSELDRFRDFCKKKFTSVREGPPSAVASIASKGQRKPSHRVGRASEYMRLTYAAKYIEWLVEQLLSAEMYRASKADIEKMKIGLESRRPKHRGRNQLKREKGLDERQIGVLLEVISPGSEFNPFADPSIQSRNCALILLLLYLGIRGGELLNIRVRDIDWSRNQIVVARRADEKDDHRVQQPLVKTLDRRIPMNPMLVEAVHKYIKNYRSKIPNARRHDYLFVTHKSGPTQGLAMSIPAYNKVVNVIASAAPELFKFHGHAMRHTWNDQFSKLMDRMNNPPEPDEQEKIRSNLQGWKPGSGSAEIYTKRFARNKGMEASIILQDSISRIPENLKSE